MVSNVAVVPLTVQTDGVDDANVTGRFADDVATNGSVVSVACVVGCANVIVCVLSPTAIATELLVTVPDDAVMDALPCAAPVTIPLPLLTVTAVPVTLYETEGAVNGLPYWSTAVYASCAVPPTLMDAVEIVRLMLASFAGTGATEKLCVTGVAAAYLESPA